MKRPFSLTLIGLGGLCGLLGVVVAACTPDTSAPMLAARSGAAALQNAPTAEVSLLQPTPALPPFTDYACLDCHTDQDKLVELAKPVEVHEALSSGPG
ncbi:MAG: hypothetical protein IT323_06305 [Anaerolineae bacterium]|nr:hypothetical protein [Anaerolineae bacterium]